MQSAKAHTTNKENIMSKYVLAVGENESFGPLMVLVTDDVYKAYALPEEIYNIVVSFEVEDDKHKSALIQALLMFVPSFEDLTEEQINAPGTEIILEATFRTGEPEEPEIIEQKLVVYSVPEGATFDCLIHFSETPDVVYPYDLRLIFPNQAEEEKDNDFKTFLIHFLKNKDALYSRAIRETDVFSEENELVTASLGMIKND